MSYKHGVKTIDAKNLQTGDSIEIIDNGNLRYQWSEVIHAEDHPSHPNRIKITVIGGRSVTFPKNQAVRYKKAEPA